MTQLKKKRVEFNETVYEKHFRNSGILVHKTSKLNSALRTNNKHISSIKNKSLPSNITPKIQKQIESIRNLAKSRTKLINNASKSCRREISIRCAKTTILAPFESTTIEIKVNKELKIADYIFTPVRQDRFPLNKAHVIEAIINKDCAWLPITNTSDKPITLEENSRSNFEIIL